MIAVFLGVALLVAGAFVVGARGGRANGERRASADAWYVGLVFAGCATAATGALRVLAGAGESFVSIPSAVPGGAWVFGLDALSAFFVLAICLVGAASAAFGVVYLGEERAHHPVGFAHAMFALVLAALLLVVSAQAVVPFLGAWEMMAVGSYFLIVHEHERPDVRQAGRIYLVATHTGTLLIIAMFAAWGVRSGDWTFAALAHPAPGVAPAGAGILVLALLGFGFKAGFVPLHFWLPPAHGSAPTHVSALMSGIVIKMGVYGLLRVATLTGAPPAWWGWTVLAAGAASGVLGVLWALAQHDVKRLLAYHSVENIGIILLGIGTGALGAAYGHPVVAALGYAGAAMHTLNHALFKSLLFFGAGLVQRATGTRDLEALGGLAKRMPRTWLAFLIGATAIVGLPPLNGFVSEWLVYLGLFRAAQAHETLRFAAFAAGALGLIGALALACFAKVSGVVFLGAPRTDKASGAAEAPRALLAPLFALAGACVVLGVLPLLGAGPALRAAAAAGHLTPAAVAPARALVAGAAAWITLLAAVLVMLATAGWLVRRRLLRERPVRAAGTWGCGYPDVTPRMQYTASSFAAPLLQMFGRTSGVVTHRTAAALETHPVDLVLDRAALPAWRRIHRLAAGFRPIQQGRLSAYLLYVMVALVLLLAYLALETSR